MRNVVEGISDRLRDNSLKPKWPTVCFCVRKKLPITERNASSSVGQLRSEVVAPRRTRINIFLLTSFARLEKLFPELSQPACILCCAFRGGALSLHACRASPVSMSHF